jgi:oligopeptide transport system substrate-binding protein
MGIATAFARVRPLLGLALMAFALSGLSACDSRNANSSASSQVLHRGLGGEPGALDPARAADSYSLELLDDLYEPLTLQAADGHVIPGVAARWVVSGDGLTYTFSLRHDAAWSNGRPVKAADFVQAWRRIVDPKSASPAADNLRLVAGARAILAGRAAPESLQVRAPADDTLSVTLEAPATYFPQLVSLAATAPIYSEAAARSHADRTWVSNGAYVLDNWVPGGSLWLKKNDRYWDRAHVQVGRVEYVPSADENAELARYRAGALDVTAGVPPNAVKALRTESPAELRLSPFLATAYYAFNLERGVFKDHPGLRQALNMTLDREVLLENVLPFGLTPAYGFVAQGSADYTPQSWDWKNLSDEERLATARTLFSTAGYSKDKPLRITLLFNSNPTIKKLAVAMSERWRTQLGVETTLVDEEYRVFLQSRKDHKRFDMVRLGWSADYNDAGNFLDTFRSGAANNDSGYRNPAYDKLLAQAAGTGDVKRRRDLLEAAERLMLADYPIMPIYFFSSKRLVKPYVRGEIGNPLNHLYTKNLSLSPH